MVKREHDRAYAVLRELVSERTHWDPHCCVTNHPKTYWLQHAGGPRMVSWLSLLAFVVGSWISWGWLLRDGLCNLHKAAQATGTSLRMVSHPLAGWPKCVHVTAEGSRGVSPKAFQSLLRLHLLPSHGPKQVLRAAQIQKVKTNSSS